jgi:malonyl CoA-acyl carrier protein transacylase
LLGATDLPAAPAEAIAIIGLGCIFPDAPNVDAFWDNLKRGHSSIREVPPSRWDTSLYWDADRSAPDKTYAKIGAFLTETTFAPKRFRIPPRVAKQMDPVQHLALDAAWAALEDAGLQTDGRKGSGKVFDRERCAVILGNSLGGETKDQTALRVAYPLIERAIRDGAGDADVSAILASVATAVRDSRPIDEDAMPGELSNVIAGRVANALDLGGPNFTVDAACASSLAAVQAAVKGLQDGDFDLAITGGADRSMDPATYVKFSKIGALSAEHSVPFDESANGFVMGEGAGILVLKRYSDAVRDDDKVYAVIRGIGGSSDGRGKGITAPNIQGQIRALDRAYALSGVDPATVDLIEAHGTSTVVGDKVEVTALSQVIGGARNPSHGPVRLGSVKSMIGHLKSAAGAASLIKTALAINYQTFPPSAGFKQARSDVPLGTSLKVQTRAEDWPTPPSGLRRAGVSAFGFGGTNFHVVLEEAGGRPGQHRPAQLPPVNTVPPSIPVAAAPPAAHPDGVWAVSGADRAQVLERLLALQRGEAGVFERTDAVRLSGGADTEDLRKDQWARAEKCLRTDSNPALLASRGVHLVQAPPVGRLAFVFPGQGNQYLGMGLDLAKRYPIVADTYAAADDALQLVLGRTLTDLLENKADDANQTLTATEHAQPAVFTLDVALLRLLKAHGVEPDLVAGHSLGEYAAAVAAGVLTFEQGLHATSARGREMADIVLEDPGRMIGVQASPERTDELLAQVKGYAISANRNCPTQTVVAGSTAGVAEAEVVFKANGVETVAIPVSHAFHSKVVAPASEPFSKVLAKLGPKPPKLPFTSNVNAQPYPSDPAAIVQLLASQLASPVSWTDQIESMYDGGVRTFIEVGPKRALSGFTRSILGKRPHYAVPTNHPKRGGIASFLDALASLTALGVPVHPPEVAGSTTELALDDVIRAATEVGATPHAATQLAASVYPALRDLMAAVVKAVPQSTTPVQPAQVRVVCAGASVGLPGGQEVFSQDNIASILAGEGRIASIGDRADTFVNRNIVRLVKDGAGGASFHPVTSRGDVIQIAGTKAHFDPRDYGVPDRLAAALDITSELGIAAAIEALRDAGIPLVQSYKETTSGKRIPTGWRLPTSLQDGTGVIFASAFPGYDQLLQKIETDNLDADGHFDRRTLFQILAMGHSQLAQFIGAKGPNTQINAACASTTQAVSIAHDWLRLGRCERVIVIGADDVTGDRLLPWIGGGFLAAGAATTAATPEEGALPFDARRHGMILGMGAVGLVLERQDVCTARGIRPIAELLATRISNSAFHGTRLDAAHIAREMTALVSDAATLDNTTAAAIAGDTMFMSHETYTPARGGSASAEADALRAAFGPDAGKVAVANTKGFTGHPMGAGIEDAIALKALQYGIVPPIANLTEPDPEFADLRLSRGENRNLTYAIRLAAGFGSQVALAMWRAEARGDDRVSDLAARTAWLKQVTGYAHVRETVGDRTLRVVASTVDALLPIAPGVIGPDPYTEEVELIAIAVPTSNAVPLAAAGGVSEADVLQTLIEVVAQQSGYAPSDLDPEFELEADLGIDTVKQAEVLSELRTRFSLEQDDQFRLADYPTLTGLAAYLAGQLGVQGVESLAPTSSEPQVALVVSTGVAAPPSQPGRSRDDVLKTLIEVVAQQSGYEPNDLDPDFELEADLGIDTVKQAEVLSELRARFSLEQDDQFRLADYPTLAGLAAYLSSQLVGMPASDSDNASPATANMSNPVAAPPAIATPVSREDVLKTLIDVVAEQSGYAPADLDPEFELEADLGIDTVKQAEVLSELRSRFSLTQDDQFRLADYPTLDGLADYLTSQLTTSGSADTGTTATPAPHTAQQPIDATLIESPTPSSVSAPERSESAVYAILADVVAIQTGYEPADLDPEFELEADLGIDTVKQAEIFSQVRERLGIEATDDLRLADTPTLGGLAAYLASRVATPTSSPPNSITPIPTVAAHVQPVADTPALREDYPIPELPSFWIRRPIPVQISAVTPVVTNDLSFYIIGTGPLAKAIANELDARGGVPSETPTVVIDVGQGVAYSMEVARALAEHPPEQWLVHTQMGGVNTIQNRAIAARDGARSGLAKALGREWERTSVRVIDLISDDLNTLTQGICNEVGVIGPDEIRISADGRTGVQYAVCDAPVATSTAQGAVVLVTGGARGIGLAIAHELAERGCTLALIGRTQPGVEPLDEVAEKNRIRAELTERGERVTPVAIDKELAPLRARDEVRKAVESVPRATYHSVDLSDADAVQVLIENVIDTHGAIHAVVHGAGVEDSRPVQNKAANALERALGAKVHGALALLDALDSSVRLISMGSVAGRFGNAGQTDYAAANDSLARLTSSHKNGLCVDWTAWGDAGMATRGGMQHLLEQRGVDLLPASIGARLVADWVFSDETGERVVAGALGGFTHRTGHAMVPEVSFDGVRVRASQSLAANEPWLIDHSIDGTGVFPGVMGVEWMATVAAELLGERPDRMQDVRFAAPLKVHAGAAAPTIIVEAHPTKHGSAWCTLSSERVLATGRVQRTLHFQCVASVGSTSSALPSVFLPDEVVEKQQIYKRFFHGPRFQVLSQIVGIAADGLIAEALLPKRALPGATRTAPLAIEAGFQAAGMHRWATRGMSGLPHSIETVEILAPPPEDAALTVTVVDHGDAYDVDVDSPNGTVARLRGLRLIDRGPVGDNETLPPPPGGRPMCFTHAVTPPPSKTARASAGIGANAKPWLDAGELALLTARGTDERKRDRTLGRVVAKRAVHLLTHAPADSFTVSQADSGEPQVEGVAAVVSLSHHSGRAVALASTEQAVGIDMEQVQKRSHAFLSDWFTPGERLLAGDSALRQTLVWSAKEATLKLLGTGFALPATAVQVIQIVGKTITVQLSDAAATVAEDRNVGDLALQWRFDVNNFVIVEATAPYVAPKAA